MITGAESSNPSISEKTEATSDTHVPETTRRQAEKMNEEEEKTQEMPVPAGEGGPSSLKVLFLSSDTGGGHRASAESLARQFELLFPGSTYALVDLATENYLPPYNSIVSYYKHLSAHPSHWKFLYGITNSRFMERAVDTNIKVMTIMCERNIRKKIKSYEPDVVVSVHPLQTSVPILSCAKISHETGKHLPMFTVVTDLGSAHSTWFANGVERMFVGSTQIYNLAKERGKVPDEKLVLLGLPIRHDFAVEAENLGDRMSQEGKEYQVQVRERLGLPAFDRKTLLVMGGGEGVGSLSNIVDALYCEFSKQGIDAVIMVVCGRNEKLKKDLEERDWQAVFQKWSNQSKTTKKSKRRGLFPIPTLPVFSDLAGCGDDSVAPVGCIEAGGVTKSLRRILSSGHLSSATSPVFIPSPTKAIEAQKDDHAVQSKLRTLGLKSVSIGPIEQHDESETKEEVGEASTPSDDANTLTNTSTVNSHDSLLDSSQANGEVSVVGLGFVTNMAEYMVAADVLISKAGPGTISEAAALSLPVMLTSFLPGQEEGNVDYVVEGGFGSYCHDSDPQAVAEEMAQWLSNDEKMITMSTAAKSFGAPYAARDIVQSIGDSALRWRELNEGHSVEPLIPVVTDESIDELIIEEPGFEEMNTKV